MRSFISNAILASAVLGQSVLGATIAHRHGHSHIHQKKEAAPVEKRNIDIASVLTTAKVKTASTVSEITTGSDGTFVVDLTNNSGKDIVVVVWSGSDAEEDYSSMCVGANSPALTQSILPGDTETISFSPGSSSSISGGIAALYPLTDLAGFGGINNTWAEYTFTTASAFSAIDVSRLINMVGNTMSIETYASYPASGDALCTSDMDNCVFQCSGGANACASGSLLSCSGPNTQNYDGTSGGCGGFTADSGYAKITFLE